ncbi:MAG: protein kinase [Pseudomonadota bacterium]
MARQPGDQSSEQETAAAQRARCDTGSRIDPEANGPESGASRGDIARGTDGGASPSASIAASQATYLGVPSLVADHTPAARPRGETGSVASEQEAAVPAGRASGWVSVASVPTGSSPPQHSDERAAPMPSTPSMAPMAPVTPVTPVAPVAPIPGGSFSTPNDANAAIAPGCMVGEYRVENQIGAGGMGAVYAGIHPRIGKRVAIKVLKSDCVRIPDLVGRFENEARAVNQIGHHNIVDIFAFGQLADGSPYFVMEWIDGQPLDRLLQNPRGLRWGALLAIVRQVCSALAAAHRHGIVHRDLKPENIMVKWEPDGLPFAKLLDFGIAKFFPFGGDDNAQSGQVTQTGAMMGTPRFMSPEQCHGRGVDHRTDVYALGVLLYRAFTGRYPFEGSSYLEIVAKQLSAPPPLPSTVATGRVSSQAEALIMRALAKEPSQRQSSVAELLQELDACPEAGPAAANLPVTEATDWHAVTEAEAAEAQSRLQSQLQSLPSEPQHGSQHQSRSGSRFDDLPAPSEHSENGGSETQSPTCARRRPGQIDSAVSEDGANKDDKTRAAPHRSRRLALILALVIGVATLLAGAIVALRTENKQEAPSLNAEPLLRLPSPRGWKSGDTFVPLEQTQ